MDKLTITLLIVCVIVCLITIQVNGQRRRCQSSSFSPNKNNSTEKLRSLRKKLVENQIQGYLIPLSDEHLSEVITENDNRLKFMTGFDGSNGLALIVDNANGSSENILFTDSRYGEAADEILDCNWSLHVCNDLLVSAIQWIKIHADPGSKIAADVRLFNVKDWMKLNEVLQSCGHSVIPQSHNLVDDVWNEMKLRPSSKPANESRVFIHDIQYSGKSWQEKVADVAADIESRKGNSLLISSLEDIAWLLNLRGNDIEYTPIFKSYVVIVSRTLVWLYVDEAKLTSDVLEHLNSKDCESRSISMISRTSDQDAPCVVIKDYKVALWASTEIINAVSNYYNSSLIKILVPESTNYFVYGMIPEQFRSSLTESPIAAVKAVKNEVEINGMKSAHVKDAVALIDFMARLSKAVIGRKSGKEEEVRDFEEKLDELSVTKLLRKLRAEQKLNRGESFETISAVDDNAAKAHYAPNNSTARTIDINSIYLLDSGGQYLDGTTDVTRVMVFNDEEFLTSSRQEGSIRSNHRRVSGLKDIYTRILMGQIDMSSFIFPAETKARDLSDLLARRHLAEVGLEYGHGTSHGIGSYLMVHENSIYIGSPRSLNIPLKEGMFTSIEPGFYEPGSTLESVRLWPSGGGGGGGGRKSVDGFGMRLENIVQVIEAKIPQLILDQNHGPINTRKKFLTFDPVTLVPYEKRLINYDLLQLSHKKWLNRYNSKIRLVVGRELKSQNRSLAFDWMMEMTEPITEVETEDRTACLQSVPSTSGAVIAQCGIGSVFSVLIAAVFFSIVSILWTATVCGFEKWCLEQEESKWIVNNKQTLLTVFNSIDLVLLRQGWWGHRRMRIEKWGVRLFFRSLQMFFSISASVLSFCSVNPTLSQLPKQQPHLII